MAAAALVSVLLLPIGTHSQEPAPAKREISKPIEQNTARPKKPTTDEQRRAVGQSIGADMKGAAKADTEAQDEQAERREKAANDRLIVWFTGVLAVVAVLQFGAMVAQFLAMAIQARHLSKTVAQMQRSEERQLRAYVNINGGKVLDPLDPTKRRAAIEVKNFGQTPAYHETMWVSTVVREFPLRSVLGQRPGSLRVGKETLPPGRTSVIEIPVGPLSAWEEAQLRNGSAAIYVSGEIRYEDGFGNGRTTLFRLFCHGEGMAAGRLAADTEGNEAT